MLWAITCCLLAVSTAQASVADAPGSQLEVAIVTYGPGDIYWERFGHDAIVIRDRDSGQSLAFNYGMFDFNQDNFLWNFIRGHMRYRIAAVPTARDLAFYRHEGRSIRRQALNLTPPQRARLRDFLLWNLQPQNAHYRYRYYTANCATKLRDALNRALDGAIRQQLQAQATDVTWRGQTRRLMAPQPALMLLLDLGLAGRADQPLNAWQASFLPGILADELQQVRVPRTQNRTMLVQADRMLAASRLAAPPSEPPELRIPLGLAGLALALLLWLTGRSRRAPLRRVFAGVATLWLLVAGLAGLLMLALWFGTAHEVAWANANLLLFNPLAWLLIPAVWRQRAKPWQQMLAWLLLLGAGIGLLGNLTGLIDQRNLPWILLTLPPWLALARVLRHPPPKHN